MAEASIVELGPGRLRGEAGDGVTVFRGIPYAAPPVGDLRFRPPAPPTPWDGVRDAVAFGAIGLQVPTPLEVQQGRMDLPQDEDCLFLNVWTPACDDARRPVLLWIHGGAWLNGTGAAHWFDGTSFARRHDIVVVTINYRLDVFGWLHLGALSADEPDSGNCGLLDQVAALRWVHDHIAAFGGDPGTVTIAGESAGSMSVATLMATPAAEGLFHRAVMQSGVGVSHTTTERAAAVTEQILHHAGISADGDAVAALRALPADGLLDAYLGLLMADPLLLAPEQLEMVLGPVVGTPSLPRTPVDATRAGASAGIPVLVGTDEHEMEIMQLNVPTFYELDETELERRFRSVFGTAAEHASAMYREAAKETVGRPWTVVDTDRLFRVPSIELAQDREPHGASTWMYLWRWRSLACDGGLGAVHTVEIPFVFNTLQTAPGLAITGDPSPSAQDLADAVHATWAQFIRHGDPNGGGLPEWPRYDRARRATMIIDVESAVEDDPERDRRLLWAGIERAGV
jgi:para-nitrobenzyl esterase